MHHHGRVDLTTKQAPARKSVQAVQREQADRNPTHHLMTLQRTVGNAEVARMLAQREAAEDELQMMRDPDLQRESPEEELQMMRDPDVQREEPEEELQMMREGESSHPAPEVGMDGGQISDSLSGRINSQRGGGTTLDSGTQAHMEQAFGDRFDDVRIHTGSEADSLNRSVAAKAFTTGSDIFFSQNASPADSHLLAHELTHVVQQRGSETGSGPMSVGPAGDSHEVEAETSAASVVSGAPAATAQRNEDPALAAISREGEEDELAM